MRRIERAGHAKALDPTLGLVPEKTVPLGESTRDSPALGPLPPPKKLPRRGHFWTPMGGGVSFGCLLTTTLCEAADIPLSACKSDPQARRLFFKGRQRVRRQHPMFREACLPEHRVNKFLSGDPGQRFRSRPARRSVYDLFLNRQLSSPVSMISQWCVNRSRRAVVIFASMNTLGHSTNARFVVTTTDVRSQACRRGGTAAGPRSWRT